jgi:nitronate monooxygenase
MANFTLETEFTKNLGIQWPLIQAPLSGGPSTPELVAAASNSGALGFLGAAYMSAETLSRACSRVKELTSRPFGINLFVPAFEPMPSPVLVEKAIQVTRKYREELGLPAPAVKGPFQENFQEQFDVMLEARPRVFSFTFGLLSVDHIKECRSRGILVWGTGTTLEEAMALQESGVDAVVAQGTEAGGHRGIFSPEQAEPNIGTSDLIQQMTFQLRCPVIASGGLMNGADIAEVLKLGAAAAQLGTAFLLCQEAGTSPAYRQALRDAAKLKSQTRLTRAFSGRWARGLENRFMREMASQTENLLPYPIQNSFTRDIRNAAARLGKSEYLSLWAGEGVGAIREHSAKDLVSALRQETEASLKI